MYKHIVVGTDGSETSMAAVREAATLAKATGATLHIASAVKAVADLVGMSASLAAAPAEWTAGLEQEASSAVDTARGQAAAIGCAVECHVISGEASQALVNLCEELNADLLVVGNRGMTGAARFLLGSVPNRCAHHAPCSVLVARTV